MGDDDESMSDVGTTTDSCDSDSSEEAELDEGVNTDSADNMDDSSHDEEFGSEREGSFDDDDNTDDIDDEESEPKENDVNSVDGPDSKRFEFETKEISDNRENASDDVVEGDVNCTDWSDQDQAELAEPKSQEPLDDQINVSKDRSSEGSDEESIDVGNNHEEECVDAEMKEGLDPKDDANGNQADDKFSDNSHYMGPKPNSVDFFDDSREEEGIEDTDAPNPIIIDSGSKDDLIEGEYEELKVRGVSDDLEETVEYGAGRIDKESVDSSGELDEGQTNLVISESGDDLKTTNEKSGNQMKNKEGFESGSDIIFDSAKDIKSGVPDDEALKGPVQLDSLELYDDSNGGRIDYIDNLEDSELKEDVELQDNYTTDGKIIDFESKGVSDFMNEFLEQGDQFEDQANILDEGPEKPKYGNEHMNPDSKEVKEKSVGSESKEEFELQLDPIEFESEDVMESLNEPMDPKEALKGEAQEVGYFEVGRPDGFEQGSIDYTDDFKEGTTDLKSKSVFEPAEVSEGASFSECNEGQIVPNALDSGSDVFPKESESEEANNPVSLDNSTGIPKNGHVDSELKENSIEGQVNTLEFLDFTEGLIADNVKETSLSDSINTDVDGARLDVLDNETDDNGILSQDVNASEPQESFIDLESKIVETLDGSISQDSFSMDDVSNTNVSRSGLECDIHNRGGSAEGIEANDYIGKDGVDSLNDTAVDESGLSIEPDKSNDENVYSNDVVGNLSRADRECHDYQVLNGGIFGDKTDLPPGYDIISSQDKGLNSVGSVTGGFNSSIQPESMMAGGVFVGVQSNGQISEKRRSINEERYIPPTSEKIQDVYNKFLPMRDKEFRDSGGLRFTNQKELLLDDWAPSINGIKLIGEIPFLNPGARTSKPKLEGLEKVRSEVLNEGIINADVDLKTKHVLVIGYGENADNVIRVREAVNGPYRMVPVIEASNYAQARGSIADQLGWTQKDFKSFFDCSGKSLKDRQGIIDHLCDRYDVNRDELLRASEHKLTIHEQVVRKENGKEYAVGVCVPKELHEVIHHDGANKVARDNQLETDLYYSNKVKNALNGEQDISEQSVENLSGELNSLNTDTFNQLSDLDAPDNTNINPSVAESLIDTHSDEYNVKDPSTGSSYAFDVELSGEGDTGEGLRGFLHIDDKDVADDGNLQKQNDDINFTPKKSIALEVAASIIGTVKGVCKDTIHAESNYEYGVKTAQIRAQEELFEKNTLFVDKDLNVIKIDNDAIDRNREECKRDQIIADGIRDYKRIEETYGAIGKIVSVGINHVAGNAVGENIPDVMDSDEFADMARANAHMVHHVVGKVASDVRLHNEIIKGGISDASNRKEDCSFRQQYLANKAEEDLFESHHRIYDPDTHEIRLPSSEEIEQNHEHHKKIVADLEQQHQNNCTKHGLREQ